MPTPKGQKQKGQRKKPYRSGQKKGKSVPVIKDTDARTPSVFNIPHDVERDSKVHAKDVFEGLSTKKKSKKASKKMTTA